MSDDDDDDPFDFFAVAEADDETEEDVTPDPRQLPFSFVTPAAPDAEEGAMLVPEAELTLESFAHQLLTLTPRGVRDAQQEWLKLLRQNEPFRINVRLRRLSNAVASKLEAQRPVTAELRKMAGLLAQEQDRCPASTRFAQHGLLLIAAANGDGRALAALLARHLARLTELGEAQRQDAQSVVVDWLSHAQAGDEGIEDWAGQDDDEIENWFAQQRAKPVDGVYQTRIVVAPPFEIDGRNDRDQSLLRFQRLCEPLPLAGSLDVDEAGRFEIIESLRRDFPWFESVIAHIDRSLRLNYHLDRQYFRIAPLLLVGPPGIGKTSFARAVSQLAGCGCGFFSASGSSDNRLLAGTARGWSTAQPCWMAYQLLEAETGNPLLVIDEVDKISTSAHNGQITQTLLTLLERSTASAFLDECLMVPLNFSRINWILTANDQALVSPVLRSRLDVCEVGAPLPEHFDCVLRGVLADIAGDLEVPVDRLPLLEPSVVAGLREQFIRNTNPRRMFKLVKRALDIGLDGQGATRQ